MAQLMYQTLKRKGESNFKMTIFGWKYKRTSKMVSNFQFWIQDEHKIKHNVGDPTTYRIVCRSPLSLREDGKHVCLHVILNDKMLADPSWMKLDPLMQGWQWTGSEAHYRELIMSLKRKAKWSFVFSQNITKPVVKRIDATETTD